MQSLQPYDVSLHEDGSWFCQHVDAFENPAPPIRLSLQQTVEENPIHPTSTPRRAVRCPDCGTRWRVWLLARIARPYTEWGPEEQSKPPRCCRAPVRDIDRIIALVREQLPGINVVQHKGTHPADDDGLWWFRSPGVEVDIQLESSYGTCPFIVEHADMHVTRETRRADTVEEAVQAVTDYFAARPAGSGASLAEPWDDSRSNCFPATDEGLVKVFVDLYDSPFETESFWAKPRGSELYELRNSPWYAFDLHFGDVVRAVPDRLGEKPRITEVVHRSGHKTLRVRFPAEVGESERLEMLQSLHPWRGFHENCNGRLYAVDVEPDGDYEAVCDHLSAWEQAGRLKYEAGTMREQPDAEPTVEPTVAPDRGRM
jgi:hypothetical protein